VARKISIHGKKEASETSLRERSYIMEAKEIGMGKMKLRQRTYLSEVLQQKDKFVVNAFLDKKSAEGRILSTDGKSLQKTGFGSRIMAQWFGNKVSIESEVAGKSDEVIFRYLKKEAPKRLIVQKKIEFASGGDAGPDGQYNHWIVAYDPQAKEEMGTIEYASYEDEYHIQMIKVQPKHQKKGVAEMLVKELLNKEKVKYRDLKWGMVTGAGAKLKAKLDRKIFK